MNPDCPVCLANAGTERISPGAPIYEGEFWVVEHAYPSALLGWLVIVLKRHAEALHDLTCAEGKELGLLQWAVAHALKSTTSCRKEYSIFFAEMPRFSHVHFHMVPRAEDLSPELRGGRVFAFLKAPEEEVVDPEVVSEFCVQISKEVEAKLRDGGQPHA